MVGEDFGLELNAMKIVYFNRVVIPVADLCGGPGAKIGDDLLGRGLLVDSTDGSYSF